MPYRFCIKICNLYARCSLHVDVCINTNGDKLLLWETFDEPLNVVDKSLKVEN